MKAGRLWGTVLGCLLWVAVPWAQNAVAPAAAPSKASSGPQAAKRPASPTPLGKLRDPFHSLIPPKKPGEAAPPAPIIHYPPGKPGLVIEQLQLQGIVRGIDGSWVAVVDNRTKTAFFLHEKDKLYNGVVSKITADSIVFLESSTDPSGKTVTREVVKRMSEQ